MADLLDEDDEPDTRTNQEYLEDEVIPLIRDDETLYAVVIEVTESKLVWLAADSAEDAVKRLERNSEWYELLGPESPTLDYSVTFDEVPSHAWTGGMYQDAVYTEEMGPRWQCPHCKHGGLHPQRVIHEEMCPLHKPRD